MFMAHTMSQIGLLMESIPNRTAPTACDIASFTCPVARVNGFHDDFCWLSFFFLSRRAEDLSVPAVLSVLGFAASSSVRFVLSCCFSGLSSTFEPAVSAGICSLQI